MEIKKLPAGAVLPLKTDELNAILLGTQLLGIAGSLRAPVEEMVRQINAREPIPLDDCEESGIATGGEESTTIVLRVLAAAQKAANEALLLSGDGTVN